MAEQNKASFKDKVLDELLENDQIELADIVWKLETDADVKNFIAGAKDYVLQTKRMPKSTIDAMPSFKTALYGTIGKSEVDLDKAFGDYGKDWYKHLNDISYQEIQEAADKAGVDWKDLNAKMAKEATAKIRADIANGEDLGGWFESPASFVNHLGAKAQQFFTPRVNEAVVRGEDPTATDYALDIGEQALYAMPWARGAGAAAKGLGKVGKVFTAKPVQWTAENAVTPIISETADAIAYDEENNPRGDFSVADVVGNTAVNAGTMSMAKGPIAGIARTFGLENLSKKVQDFGAGKTAKEITSEALGKYKHAPIRKSDDPTITVGERAIAKEMRGLSESDPALYRLLTKNPVGGKIPKGSKWSTLSEIMGAEGGSVEEKAKNMLKKRGFNPDYSYITPDGRIFSGNDANDLINILQQHHVSIPSDLFVHSVNPKHPFGPVGKELMNSYDKYATTAAAAEGAKSASQLAAEESVKNYISNHVGPALSEQRRGPFGIVPVLGPALEEQIYGTKEEQEREAEQLKKELIMEELVKKYPSIIDIFGK